MFEKTIIVTGGLGFIASNFLNILVPKFPNIRFVNLDNESVGRLENIQNTVKNSHNYDYFCVDLCDEIALRKIFEHIHPTDIIHFAAQSHVDVSIKKPKQTLENNINATQDLLELHREFWLHRFHYISTDEVYGDNIGDEIFTENSPFRPSSPYAASKAWADLLVQVYGRTYGIDYTITRSANNYGPNQNTHSFIPVIMQKCLQFQKIPIFGNGLQKRNWIFVDDHVEAIWQVFSRAKKGSIYNIGGNFELSNLQLAYKILDIFGLPQSNIEFVKDRPWHDISYTMNSQKIYRELGFENAVNFDAGLQKTREFYQKQFL